jgi:hypothetical protein
VERRWRIGEVDVSALTGVWFHSHEEDEGDRIVYRDSTYDFPRSRAPRQSLAIEPDGTAVFGEPGPAEATEASAGRWEVSEGGVRLRRPSGGEEFEVESLEGGVLVLRRRA